MVMTGKIHWDEGALSESGNKASAFLHYFVYSDDPDNEDRGDAFDWVRANAPDFLFGLGLEEINVKERIAEAPNADEPFAIWDATVKYVNPQRRKPREIKLKDPKDGPQDVRVSIRSGTGGRLKRTQSIALLGEVHHVEGSHQPWKWEGDPQLERLLNLEADSKEDSASMFVAKGIDVPVGTVEIVVETIISNNVAIASNYLINTSLHAGENVVNQAVYRGFPIRCLKLINFDAEQQADEEEAATDLNDEGWEITFVFAYAPEVKAADIQIAPGLTENDGTFSVNKGGWDYMDTLYVNTEYETAFGFKFVIPQARRQSIHQIYKAINFAQELRI